jgi:hypothetical protein
MLLALLVAAASLMLGAAVAPARDGGGPGDGGGQRVVVAGTIVSVDAAHNSFVANAYIVQRDEPPQGDDAPGGPPDGDQGGTGDEDGQAQGDSVRHDSEENQPTPTQVTIGTDPTSTKFRVGDEDGTISDLAAGQRFVAMFNGSPTEDITTLVQNNPPIGVMAETPPAPKQLYAFVGTVTAVDTTAGTVTVNVTNTVPSGLVPAASNPATFTIGGDTLILGGSSGSGLSWGSLSNVSVGDVVAGGLIGTSGETLSQVESTELRLLLDFPTSSGSGGGGGAPVTKAAALNRAKALLGFKGSASTANHKHKRHKKHKGHR